MGKTYNGEVEHEHRVSWSDGDVWARHVVLTGELVMYHSRKRYGTIVCDSEGDMYHRDVVLNGAVVTKAGLDDPKNGDRVLFTITYDLKTGLPEARDLRMM